MNPQIDQLVREIRDLYVRHCALADQYNKLQIAEAASLKEKFRARSHPALPELERFESAFDAMDAMQTAQNEPDIKRRREWAMLVTWLVSFYFCWKLMQYSSSLLVPVVVCVALGAVMIFIGQHSVFGRNAIQRSLRRQLRERGVAICISCGYDLRGQTVARCPECGVDFDMRGTAPAGS